MSNKALQVIKLEDRSSLYRNNHNRIIESIESFIDDNHFPTVTEIANDTGLTRQTVHAHLPHIKYFNLEADDSHLVEVRRQRIIDLLYDYAIGKWYIDSSPSNTLKAMQMYMKWTEPKECIEPLQTLTVIPGTQKEKTPNKDFN